MESTRTYEFEGIVWRAGTDIDGTVYSLDQLGSMASMFLDDCLHRSLLLNFDIAMPPVGIVDDLHVDRSAGVLIAKARIFEELLPKEKLLEMELRPAITISPLMKVMQIASISVTPAPYPLPKP